MERQRVLSKAGNAIQNNTYIAKFKNFNWMDHMA